MPRPDLALIRLASELGHFLDLTGRDLGHAPEPKQAYVLQCAAVLGALARDARTRDPRDYILHRMDGPAVRRKVGEINTLRLWLRAWDDGGTHPRRSRAALADKLEELNLQASTLIYPIGLLARLFGIDRDYIDLPELRNFAPPANDGQPSEAGQEASLSKRGPEGRSVFFPCARRASV